MKSSIQANLILPLVKNLIGFVWLGLTDIQNEGVFVWSSSQSNLTWSNWKLHEPDGNTTQVSISPTFYSRVLQAQILKAQK